MSNRFEILGIRYKMNDPTILLVTGWFAENQQKDTQIKFLVDDEKLDYEVEERKSSYVIGKKLSSKKTIDTEYFYWVRLPENLEGKKQFIVKRIEKKKNHQVAEIKISDILKMRKEIAGNVDLVGEEKGVPVIRGWVACAEKPTIEICSITGKNIPVKIRQRVRRDVMFEFPEIPQEQVVGYEIKLSEIKEKNVQLVIRGCGKKYTKNCRISYGKIEKVLVKSQEKLVKSAIYVKNNGIKHTVVRGYEKLFHKEKNDYRSWRKKYILSKEELAAQKKERFTYEPKISIVIPLYKTPEKYLKELIDAVRAQTYSNWELCFSDGSGGETPLRKTVRTYQKKDSRIKMVCSAKPLQISANTNAALKIATGDFIAFADHDDLLTADALYENIKVLNENPEIDFIYSDEDKIDMNGKDYFEPHFKPDFNLDLLRTTNYICHFVVVRKTIVDEIGGLKSEFDGAQDFDFVLRCTEKTSNIYHIPKVLYHWRAHKDSTAENPESKMYAFENGAKAIQAYYDRNGIDATVEMRRDFLGIYRTIYHLGSKPLVSIIIPNKDHIDDLKKCIAAIEEKSTYENLEYIIVENNSTEEETFAYYENLQQENKRVKVIAWKDEFNYSAINNYGVTFAKGEYLLFLNNDTEIINRDCIEEMLGYCMRDDVGIVGARLYYPDDTIQHAGVIVGIGGVAGHCFTNMPKEGPGYFARAFCAQDYSAVTAACMMVKRSVFEEVNGFDEKLKVAFNDIDFCLRVRETGKLIVYNPYAELYHYESKSRGQDDTEEKENRFNSEIDLMQLRWQKILTEGDPYYNPNLSINRNDFSLK